MREERMSESRASEICFFVFVFLLLLQKKNSDLKILNDTIMWQESGGRRTRARVCGNTFF